MSRIRTFKLFPALALVVLTLIGAAVTQAAPLVTVGENHNAVTYDTWQVWENPNRTNGAAHGTWLKDSTAEFTFKGTQVIWVTEKGNPMGKAQVLIDGEDKGTFDLYDVESDYQFPIYFRDLSDTKHVITIKVLGEKNPAAVSSYVFVDAFVVKQQVTENNSPRIQYNSWRGAKNVNATNGTFRVTRTADATAKFVFTGTSVKWITAKGPKYGQAEVFIDNVSQGIVDLYAPTNKWQVKRKYTGLSNAQHSIEIKVLGQKNPAATNSFVVVDGFIYQ